MILLFTNFNTYLHCLIIIISSSIGRPDFIANRGIRALQREVFSQIVLPITKAAAITRRASERSVDRGHILSSVVHIYLVTDYPEQEIQVLSSEYSRKNSETLDASNRD